MQIQSPEFIRNLPGVERLEVDPITYLDKVRIEKQRDESLQREMEISSEQRQREQLPEATSAPSFGPQAEQEMEREVDLPVVRKRTLELMQKHMVVRGLHPGVLDANLSLDARGVAEPYGRGGNPRGISTAWIGNQTWMDWIGN